MQCQGLVSTIQWWREKYVLDSGGDFVMERWRGNVYVVRGYFFSWETLLLTYHPCMLCITYSWPLHTEHYTALNSLDPWPLHSMHYTLHTKPLQNVHYVFLNPVLCMLHTPGLSTLCIMHSWSLHSLYITYYWPLHSALCISDPCNLCILHSLPLHSVHIVLLATAICALYTTDHCTLCITHLSTLFIIHTCRLHSVH